MEAVKHPVTKGLILLCVLIHAYAWFFLPLTEGPAAVEEFFARFGLLPASFRAGAVWQPLTAALLHGSLFHLIVIMIGFWTTGRALEVTLGSARFAWLCFFSGASSSLAIILFQPDLSMETVGGSGILAGLVGALALFYPNGRILFFLIPMKIRTAVLILFIVSLAAITFGFLESISHVGHLGGLVGGVLYSRFALGLKFLNNDLHKQESYLRDRMLEQEMLRNMFERLTRGRSNERWRNPASGPDVPRERVINPMPGEEPEPRVERRLHYDPITNKFYVR